MLYVLRLLLLISLALTGVSAHAVLDVGRMDAAPLSLTRHVTFLEDTTGRLSLADIERQEAVLPFRHDDSHAFALNFGISPHPWWLRFSLRNDADQPVERYVEVGNSRLTRVAFYQPDLEGGYHGIHTGSLTPFDTRPYLNRNFVFPLTLAPHSTATYYVRVEASSSLSIPARVWTPDGFRSYERKDDLTQGLYLGMASAIALSNLFLFFALREKLYLVYLGVVFSITFTVCSHNGLVKQWVGADSPAWSLSSASVGYAITVALLLLFMRLMLSTPSMLPRADRWLQVVMWIYLLPVPLALALFHQSVIYLIHYLTLSVIGLELMVGLYLCWLGQRSAYLFMMAYGVLVTVVVINLVASIGLISAPWDIGWSTQVALAFEMVLLSMVLADRMSQIRLERDRSQKLVVQVQASLVDELRSSERRLAQLVSQRVDELRRLIDMLSHEIRTPMSVIRMCLSMDEPSERNRELARQAVHDVDEIIERCLEADQIDHGSVALTHQHCRVDTIAQGLAAAHLESARIAVTAPDPCEVETDLRLLKILLSNLIDNALKYSPSDAVVQLTVRTSHVNHRTGTLVRVSNPVGPAGWPDPAHLFQKFYRSPAAHGKSGSGLGLYLVREFAQLLGGRVDYVPDVNCVHFELWMPR